MFCSVAIAAGRGPHPSQLQGARCKAKASMRQASVPEASCRVKIPKARPYSMLVVRRATALMLLGALAATAPRPARASERPLPGQLTGQVEQAAPQQSSSTSPGTTSPTSSTSPQQDRDPIGNVGPSPSLRSPMPDNGPNTQPDQSATQTGQGPATSAAPPEPVGTAVAPAVRSEGVPVSRPAGAAIAPQKQHRKRTLAIRVGLIVGAAVAVGAVTAASLSSPSRPN